MWDNFVLLIFWAYLIVPIFFDNLQSIFILFYSFLNFLIILFCVALDNEQRCWDQYALGPSKSMTETVTLNHGLTPST